MEIDDTLKNRLAGTAVITVLAVIFLPMMFDSPVEKKGQVVSEIDIPHKPEVSPLLTTAIVPDKSSQTLVKPKPAATNATAQPAEDLTDNAEKPDTDSGKAPLDADAADVEQEKPAVVKKKTHKKAPVAAEKTDEPDEEPSPLKQPEKKAVKAKVEKKPFKPELPVLDANDQDKTSASLPHLDSPPTLDNRRWMVQVASLSDQAKATAFRDKLRAQGFPATVDSVWIKGKGRVYRLKVGPELDAQKAQSTKAKINQLNNVKSIAIPE